MRTRRTAVPVVGATVRVTWESDGQGHAVADQAQLIGDGGFVDFGPVPADATRLTARIEDAVATPALVKLPLAASRRGCLATVDMQVGGLGSLCGRVLDTDGRPAADSELSIQPQAAGSRQLESFAGRADSQGNFRVNWLDAEDRFVVTAQLGDKSSLRSGWTIARAGERGVVVHLLGAESVRVSRDVTIRVVDSTGALVPKFDYEILGDSTPGGDCTDGVGLISCTGRLGPMWIEVWNPRNEVGSPLALGPAFVGPVIGTGTTAVLPRGLTSTGLVFDAAGRGVANVRLWAMPWSASDLWPDDYRAYSQAISDGDGRFNLGRLPPHRLRVFLDTPDGFAHHDSIMVRGGSQIEDVTLESATRVRLRVLAEDGSPQAGVPISVLVPREGLGLTPMGEREAGQIASARTDGRGVAELPGLDPRRSYVLQANQRSARSRHEFRTLRIPNWEPRDDTIVLPPALSLAGRILGSDRGPVANARLELHLESGQFVGTVTGERGQFAFADLPEGAFKLEVWAPASALDAPPDTTCVARSGDRDLTLHLPVSGN